MPYKNSMPTISDLDKSKAYKMKPTFRFEEGVTKEEAAEGIIELIRQNDGKIPLSWIESAN